MALNHKQKLFVEAYAGNATEAALAAGYKKKSARAQGQRLLTNADIVKAIREREAAQLKPFIASRDERQEFFTKIMRDEEERTVDRIKAGEALCKMNGDFLERREHTFPDPPKVEVILNAPGTSSKTE